MQVYLPCVLQTKKRYVGYMYETLEQKEPVFDAKGIETVRRDACPAVGKVTASVHLARCLTASTWPGVLTAPPGQVSNSVHLARCLFLVEICWVSSGLQGL